MTGPSPRFRSRSRRKSRSDWWVNGHVGQSHNGAHVTIERLDVGQPFRAMTDGLAFAAACEAQSEAFGRESQIIGSGGSILLLNTLQRIVTDAECILWGAQDVERARIHGADESVDQAELARCFLAQARFYELYGSGTQHNISPIYVAWRRAIAPCWAWPKA
jgi:hypothetical protein